MSTPDATGARIREARIVANEPAAFTAYFQSLPEPSCVVGEACWNWGWLYDELGEIDGVARFPRANKLCCYAGLVPTTPLAVNLS